VIELDEKDQRKLWEEVSHVCNAVKSSFGPGLKLNIAAIGNVVCASLPVCLFHGSLLIGFESIMRRQ